MGQNLEQYLGDITCNTGDYSLGDDAVAVKYDLFY
jgi:hypothetical protein